jgi:hypothetical protein
MALRLGAEEKKKVYLASGLGLLMLLLLIRFVWQNFGPSPAPPEPAVTPQASAPESPSPAAPSPPFATSAAAAVKVGSLSSLDPTLHPEIMHQAETLQYTGNGRNIFSQFSDPADIPKPVASARPNAAASGPPAPPPPPPIELRFYGYAAEKSGHKEIFLLHGDDIFIASEGEIVDRRYRVGKIGVASVQIEDLPYHDTQTLPLQQ